MANDLQDQLKAAIELAQQGQRDAARGLLLRVVESDPQQELAWMWLAVVSTDRDERLKYLERTLAINPTNERALSAYTKLTGRIYEPGAAAAAPARPAAPPRAEQPARVDWTDTLETRRSPLITLAILAVTILVLAGGGYYFASQLRNEDDEPDATATLDPIQQATLNATLGTPDSTPTLRFSLTPSLTPLPTVTPGPSPTSIWSSPPPTWTSVPTATPVPTLTPLPSFTPLPTATATIPVTYVSPTPRPTREGTAASPVTATPSLGQEPTAPATPG